MFEKGKIRLADKLQAVEHRFGVWFGRHPESDPRLQLSYSALAMEWKLEVGGTAYTDRDIDVLIEKAFPYKSYM